MIQIIDQNNMVERVTCIAGSHQHTVVCSQLLCKTKIADPVQLDRNPVQVARNLVQFDRNPVQSHRNPVQKNNNPVPLKINPVQSKTNQVEKFLRNQ